MAFDWTKADVIPRSGLEAWHQYEEGVSANNLVNDYSGNGRHLTCGAGNSPVLQADLLNGQPGWYFNGSRDPLNWNGSVTTRHLFLLASYEDAAFPDFKGLYSNPGLNSGDIVISKTSSSDEFFDFSGSITYDYRKSDVSYPMAASKAPMSGQHALIEVSSLTGFVANGIRVGQQQALARLWKGWYFESLAYSRVLTEIERLRIYEYAAMRYHLWPKVASGLNRFPFPANKAGGSEFDQETYLSEPYEGDLKALVRGSFKAAYQFPFALRRGEEFVAAKAFRSQHGMVTHWIYRDHRFNTPLDYELRFTSPIREQGSDVTYRFNYSFDALETA